MNFIKKIFWNKLQDSQKKMHDEDNNNILTNGDAIGHSEDEANDAHETAHAKVNSEKNYEFASGESQDYKSDYNILTASDLPCIVDNEELLPISIGLTSNIVTSNAQLCLHENQNFNLDCKKSTVEINKYEPINSSLDEKLDTKPNTDSDIVDEINSKGDVEMTEEAKVTFFNPEASSKSSVTEKICVSCNNNNEDKKDTNNNIYKETGNVPKYTMLTNVEITTVKVEPDCTTYNYNFKTKNIVCAGNEQNIINVHKETNDYNLTASKTIKFEVVDEDQISLFKILKPNNTIVSEHCERFNGDVNGNNFTEPISISSTDENSENAIFSISSNDSRIVDGEDSDYCSGYESSDFEFITETEAKKAGITFKDNKVTLKHVEIMKDFDTDSDKPHKPQHIPPGPDNRHIFRAPRNYIEVNENYRENHRIPEGDSFLHLFQGIYAPMVPRSICFLDNKSTQSSQPAKGLDGVGFDVQILSRRHDVEIETNEKLRREEKESVKRILSVYPAENKKRRR